MNIRCNIAIAAAVVAGSAALLSSAPAIAVPKIIRTLDELALERTNRNRIVPLSRIHEAERQREGVEVATTEPGSSLSADEVDDASRDEEFTEYVRSLRKVTH
ncbi:hypothetical protein [Synechococcus sp. PCC 7336]|uniref:hypothetical protein n=1 Tax=Synechococcus sp. PCC 7336 TaxID=195250 RepID=UPI000345E3B1|nr:hypothetical protein [Synechococcus sp. PCC 7336]